MNSIANDNSGKPDDSKVARPVWGWGRAVTHVLHHDKNSIISNCHVQIYFPPNRLETAKHISQMLGETTVIERQFTVSGKRTAMMHGQVSESIKSDKRPLLTPDEVMALPGPKKNEAGDITEPGEMIIRMAGFPPIRGRQPLYFLDEMLLARAKLPAPADTDRIGVVLTGGGDFDAKKYMPPIPAAEQKAEQTQEAEQATIPEIAPPVEPEREVANVPER